MSQKEIIARLLEAIETQTLDYAARLSPEQRAQVGSLKTWAPKETICHWADWIERMLVDLPAALKGEAHGSYPNFLEINDECFEANCRLGWAASLERFQSALRETRLLLDSLSEADLARADLPPADNPRPAWRRIVSNAVEHPMIHLGYLYQELGDQNGFSRIEEALVADLRALDPGNPDWEGVLLYNLACADALAGRTANAIAKLKEALQLNPGLTDYSKEDADFNSIRQEPAYQALYS